MLVFGGNPNSDQCPPIMAKQSDVTEIRRFDKFPHPGHVSGIAVIGLPHGFIRFTEADQVGRDHTKPGVTKRRNHFAVQVRPARFAMQQQYDRTVGRAFVHVVHA